MESDKIQHILSVLNKYPMPDPKDCWRYSHTIHGILEDHYIFKHPKNPVNSDITDNVIRMWEQVFGYTWNKQQ
jgi:hypothetical protein